MIKKYCRVLEEVYAIQAGFDNANELQELIGKNVKRYGKDIIYYEIDGINRVLWKGEWLIKHRDGRLEMKSDSLFKIEYEPKE